MISKDYVSLRGTRNGILVSLSEECQFAEGLAQFRAQIDERAGFFAGSPLSLDLGWREISENEYEMLMALVAELNVRLLGIISTSLATRRLFESKGIKVIIGTLGLAKHGGRARNRGEALEPAARPKTIRALEQPSPLSTAPSIPADADAVPTMLVRKTIRSGQRVKFAGNIVVMGDVNSGAEVEADGDVIVLGNLRGRVHAGASGNAAAAVYALNLHAAHVRIADVMGAVKAHKSFHSNSAVHSRVVDGSVATSVFGS